jgi:hypothetical protein
MKTGTRSLDTRKVADGHPVVAKCAKAARRRKRIAGSAYRRNGFWGIRLLFDTPCSDQVGLDEVDDTLQTRTRRHKEDQVLKIEMAQGINMAHNRLQDIISKLE